MLRVGWDTWWRKETDRGLLSKPGEHNIRKSCLYFKKLADLAPSVLEQLVAGSVAEISRRDRHTTEIEQQPTATTPDAFGDSRTLSETLEYSSLGSSCSEVQSS